MIDLSKLPPVLLPLLVDLVKALSTPGGSPKDKAERLIEEHARVIAFDETMKKLKPKKPKPRK